MEICSISEKNMKWLQRIICFSGMQGNMTITISTTYRHDGTALKLSDISP